MANTSISVLLVEDDEIDVMGVKRAFQSSKSPNNIIVAGDGLRALEILRDRNSILRPYLVLLDLNMPRMGGIEFLDEIRKDEELKNTIVFVLTTSKAPDDIQKAQSRHIAGYIVKGRREGGFIDVAELLNHYARVCEVSNESGE